MKKKLVIFICIVLFLCSSCAKNGKFLTVTGVGTTEFDPNLVNFSITVEHISPILTDSVAKTKSGVMGILEVCHTFGVSEQDIKSSHISTNQVFHWQNDTGKRVLEGYSSSQTTNITFRTLEKLEEFTAALFKQDIASMNRMEFGHSDSSSFESEATLKALDNAKEEAGKIADRMGVKLGEVIYISDNGADYSGYRESINSPMMFAKASADSGVVASPGLLSVTRSVLVKYRIK